MPQGFTVQETPPMRRMPIVVWTTIFPLYLGSLGTGRLTRHNRGVVVGQSIDRL